MFRRRTALLIGIVATIVLAVTLEQRRYAQFVVARKETGTARVRHLWARFVGERFRRTGTQTFAVRRHVHLLRTQTREALVRCTDANVRTVVRFGARIRAALNGMGVHLQVHQAGHIFGEHVDHDAVIFVRREHFVRLPIVPVHQIFVDANGKRMRDARVLVEYRFEGVAVQITTGNVVFARIHPVHTFGNVIDGDAVRPHHSRFGEEHTNFRTVQIRTGN